MFTIDVPLAVEPFNEGQSGVTVLCEAPASGDRTCCANLNSVRIWASSKSLFFEENRLERRLLPPLRASLNREASR